MERVDSPKTSATADGVTHQNITVRTSSLISQIDFIKMEIMWRKKSGMIQLQI
jgi:hypothetical protein